jgi:hypothetical protein
MKRIVLAVALAGCAALSAATFAGTPARASEAMQVKTNIIFYTLA